MRLLRCQKPVSATRSTERGQQLLRRFAVADELSRVGDAEFGLQPVAEREAMDAIEAQRFKGFGVVDLLRRDVEDLGQLGTQQRRVSASASPGRDAPLGPQWLLSPALQGVAPRTARRRSASRAERMIA